MIWYKMRETIGDYEEGQEYAELPDDIKEDYPDSFSVADGGDTSVEINDEF